MTSLPSRVQTGASLVIKVMMPDGNEKTLGFITDISFTSVLGQKAFYVVDTPFPATINQSAAPSFVRGTMNALLIKTSTLESCGLVPYKTAQDGNIFNAATKPIHIRLYDRESTALVYSLDFVKTSHYTITVQTKAVVRASLTFEGFWASAGPAY